MKQVESMEEPIRVPTGHNITVENAKNYFWGNLGHLLGVYVVVKALPFADVCS